MRQKVTITIFFCGGIPETWEKTNKQKCEKQTSEGKKQTNKKRTRLVS